VKRKNGFTLFELLVSISIIGILTAVVAFSFSSAQKKARDSRRVTDMNTIQKAAEQYYSANNYTYPTSITMPWAEASGTAIMYNFPVDPKNSGDYVYTSNFPDGIYCVCALLEEAGKGNAANSVCGFRSAGLKNYFCVKSQQ
jgi:prepilin-type N-terminal cleavage/methylation domain-containing protein